MFTELFLGKKNAPPAGRAGKRRTRGQGLVEFALVLPVLLLMIFGIIEFARIFYSWLIVTNAVRTGERYAVTGEYMPKYCEGAYGVVADSYGDHDGDPCEKIPNPNDPDQDASRAAEEDYARLMSIVEVTNSAATGLLRGTDPTPSPLHPTLLYKTSGYFHIVVCSASTGNHDFVWVPMEKVAGQDCHCNKNGVDTDDAGNPMNGTVRVMVALTYEHPLIMPLIASAWPHLTLHAERSGLLEAFRVARGQGVPPGGMWGGTFTDTPTSTNTETYTITLSPTQTQTFTQTLTPTVTLTNTSSPTKTLTETRTPTTTQTPTPTVVTDTPTVTKTPRPTKTFTNSPTITYTPSKTYTPSNTFTPSNTYTPSKTFTPTSTYTPSNTFTRTSTPTVTNTATRTFTPSNTFTPSKTNTPTNTFTKSNTPTKTNTPTNTFTPSKTLTPSNTPITPSKTNTPITPSPTNTPIPPSPTNTPVTPSKTNTPITPSPTRTPGSPTKTPTRTNVPTDVLG
jgi:hypothetical protein